MDRTIAYPGQVPAVEDMLMAQKFAMIGIGRLAEATMGEVPVAVGLAPTLDASANLTIGPGALSAPNVTDELPYGVLGVDPSPLTKQAILSTAVTMALGANTPTTAGQAVNVLIQASITEQDAGSIVLAYYNTSAPTIPFNGPAGSGAVQPTMRQTTISLAAVVGTAAAAGTQVTPAPSAEWAPLYVVTLTAGSAPTIATHPGAPFLVWTLPQLTPGYSRLRVFSSSGAFVVPRGSTLLKVRLCGGGGGGGAGAASLGGAGGGAGGYAEGIVVVAAGQSIPVTVGAAGSGAIAGGAASGSGGTSAFGGISASGGGGGASAASFAFGGPPGVGVGGSLNVEGGYGSDGNGGSITFPGNGGASFFGGGGRAASAGSSIQQNGTAPGSGGGGCYSTSGNGGNGAPGVVIVEY